MKRIDNFLNVGELIEKEIRPDFIKTFIISKLLSFSIIVLIIFILLKIELDIGYSIFLIPVLLLIFSLVTTYIKCALTTYYITNQKIIIEKGIIGRDYDIVKLDRILDVNLDVSVLDAILGTGCIKLCTANDNEPVSLSDIRNPKTILKIIKF